MEVRPNAYEVGDWNGFSVRMVSLYEGAPSGILDGFSVGSILAVWRLEAGEVLVRKDGRDYLGRAGEWLVSQPGERYQRFSSDARMVSVHFLAESTCRLLQWRGPYSVELGADAGLDAALKRLRREASRWRLPSDRVRQSVDYHMALPGVVAVNGAALGLFGRLIGGLAQRGLTLEAFESADPRVNEGLRRLVERRLDEPFSREEIAGRMALSASRMDRVWRRELGVTPFQFWERRRLEWCCAQLGGGMTTIKEIASALGFGSLSRFSVWFRTNRGQSPREFRRMHIV